MPSFWGGVGDNRGVACCTSKTVSHATVPALIDLNDLMHRLIISELKTLLFFKDFMKFIMKRGLGSVKFVNVLKFLTNLYTVFQV